MTEPVLDACHFCGEREADFVNVRGLHDTVVVECGFCEARGPKQKASGSKSARENALDAWNGPSFRGSS